MSGPTLESVLAEHVRGDWSDHTYSCGGCRSRFEESTREAWVNGTEEERMAIREELGRHIKPDWTLADYNAHVAAAVVAWIEERLAAGDVRAAAARAIFDATDVTLRKRYEEGNSVSGYDDEYATAALTAVRAALGEGVTGREAHATGVETGAEGGMALGDVGDGERPGECQPRSFEGDHA